MVFFFVGLSDNVSFVLGLARVKYSSAQCASYARDKLDSFEYPTGYRVAVRYPMYAASR